MIENSEVKIGLKFMDDQKMKRNEEQNDRTRPDNTIDRFFCMVLRIQNCIYSIEQKCSKNHEIFFILSCGIIIVLAVIMAITGNNNIITPFVGCAVFGFGCCIGFSTSLKKLLRAAVLYNIIFAVSIYQVINETVGIDIKKSGIITIFSFVWIFFSIVTDSEISGLVNEIISGFSAALFTILSYLISRGIRLHEALVNSGQNSNTEYETLLIAEKYIGVLLPIIGISFLCVALTKAKSYWVEKIGTKKYSLREPLSHCRL